MGRPPHGGGPVFRFTPNEVMEMEAYLQDVNILTNSIPPREIMCTLAEKFSVSADRAGKIVVQPKQVLNWFQNRRYSQRTKVREPVKLITSHMPRDAAGQFRNVAPVSIPQGSNSLENIEVEFEAKSARDGAWYDVSAFRSHRLFETGDPEVQIRFSGFGVEEDEWINVRKCVRQRSLPCEAVECATVLPGDLILCFQEGKEQALYYDAHVLDTQRRRHDVRGCRCRFLVRYDNDQSEEIVSLRKICRRPETDYRLELLQSSLASGSADARSSAKGHSHTGMFKDENLKLRATQKQRKLMDVNTDGVMTIALPALPQLNVPAPIQTENAASTIEHNISAAQDNNISAAQDNNISAAQESPMNDATTMTGSAAKPHEINTEEPQCTF